MRIYFRGNCRILLWDCGSSLGSSAWLQLQRKGSSLVLVSAVFNSPASYLHKPSNAAAAAFVFEVQFVVFFGSVKK